MASPGSPEERARQDTDAGSDYREVGHEMSRSVLAWGN